MKQKTISYLLLASLAIWPFIKELRLNSVDNFSTGKWSPWTALGVNPTLLLILPVCFYLLSKSRYKDKLLIIAALLLIITSAFFYSSPTTTILNVVVVIILSASYSRFKLTSKQKEQFIYTIIFVSFFQILLAGYQVIMQHSLGLTFLNEPSLSLATKGVSKLSIPFINLELLRGYGTFSHPNILAAFLILVYYQVSNYQLKFKKLIQSVLSLGIVLTFSRLILIGLLVKFCYLNYRQIKATLFDFLPLLIGTFLTFIVRTLSPHTAASNLQRIHELSIQTISSKPAPWEIVPIHNSYLVLYGSLGIIGVLLICYFFVYLKYQSGTHKNILTLLAGLFIFDHFFLSLPVGIYLFLVAMYPLYHSEADKGDLPAG